MSGGFFTFEGIDGCGKTTQIKLVSEFLSYLNIKNYVTREPGGTQLSSKIRDLILLNDIELNEKFSHKAQFYLFLASMSQNIDQFILPALKEGKVVISDRFFDSTMVYQKILCHKSFSDIKRQMQFLFGGLRIDITILLDIEPLSASERLESRETNRFDNMPLKFYQDLRTNYLKLEERNYRIKKVDANRKPVTVFRDIMKHFDTVLKIDGLNHKINTFFTELKNRSNKSNE